MKDLLNLVFVAWLALTVGGCGGSAKLPNPVKSKDGLSYIPIDETAFLIPEKTWLKGYARNSTDGSVNSLTLHATVPDVQSWSPERHHEMYWPAGPGRKLLIYLWGDRAYQVSQFPNAPKSIAPQFEVIEEESDQAHQGLRRFRQISKFNPTPDELERLTRSLGNETIEKLRAKHGTPMTDAVYYELIVDEKVRYYINCTDRKEVPFPGCHLRFPWGRTIMVDVEFSRRDLNHAVGMAELLAKQLHSFEAAGLEGGPIGR